MNVTTHPLILEIGVAFLFLSPTALHRLYRAYVRSRLRFHRSADATWRAEERKQRAQDRAEARAARLAAAAVATVPDSNPRYREIMRLYYASQILTPGDPYGALLACRWQVGQAWRDALDTTNGGAA